MSHTAEWEQHPETGQEAYLLHGSSGVSICHVFRNVLESLGALDGNGTRHWRVALWHPPSAAVLTKCEVDLLTFIVLRGFQAGKGQPPWPLIGFYLYYFVLIVVTP